MGLVNRTFEWMQPAPANHAGPMRVGLRKPEADRSRSAGLHPTACSVIAGGVRVHHASSNDATLPKAAHDDQRKVRTPGKSPPRSRRAAGCCQWQVGKAHAQLPATGNGAFISRIKAPSQQDQIGRSRGWWSRRPGTNRPLSLTQAGTAGTKSNAHPAATQRLRHLGHPKQLFNSSPNVEHIRR